MQETTQAHPADLKVAPRYSLVACVALVNAGVKQVQVAVQEVQEGCPCHAVLRRATGGSREAGGKKAVNPA